MPLSPEVSIQPGNYPNFLSFMLTIFFTTGTLGNYQINDRLFDGGMGGGNHISELGEISQKQRSLY